jgi:hypothetical protein
MMPRYHFDLVDQKTVADHGGRVLRDDAQAEDVADRLAAELAKARVDLLGRNYAILVTNESGEEIHRAPLDARTLS